MRASGARFRNEIVTGVGGKQTIVEDPSGNPIELFQPTIAEATLQSSSGESPNAWGQVRPPSAQPESADQPDDLDWTFEL